MTDSAATPSAATPAAGRAAGTPAHAAGASSGGPGVRDAVVAIAGAGGMAGPAIARTLVARGARVALADHSDGRIGPLADTLGRDHAAACAVDLLDEAATQAWAASLIARYGHVDGVVHLVGGWRGGVHLRDADLSDWQWLSARLVTSLQHTSRAFYDALLASGRGRFAMVSATAAARPSATAAAYAAAKAAAEAWTLALADAFRGTTAAAVVLVVQALTTTEQRRARPEASFAGYTDVDELADVVAGLWDRPADAINGQRLWLTPETP